ncbi:MAG: putative calcyclin-binding protein, partial [Streblomastix strix]
MAATDADELEALAAQALRPRVKELLLLSAAALRTESKASEEAAPEVITAAPLPVTKSYVDIQTCAYADENDDIILYWELPGVGTVGRDHIQTKFEKDSVVCTIEGYNSLNYRLSVGPLWGEIVGEQSEFRLLKNSVKLILRKSNRGRRWDKLKREEDRFAKSQKDKKKDTKTNPEDPGAGLMDLMKNLYETGDDEMKRTIAKAWTESQDKQRS